MNYFEINSRLGGTEMLAKVKRGVIQGVHRGIVNFWVRPLETLIIPHLERRPGRLYRFMLKSASWCANAGRLVVLEMRVLVFRWVGQDWSVTYIGNGYSAPSLKAILFPNPPQVKETQRAFLWQVPGLAHKFAAEGDLVICELKKIIHLSPRGLDLSFTTPQSIRQVLDDIDRPLDAIIAGMQKHTRKRIRQLQSQGFSYEITHAQADFDLFYHRMYLPYVQERYGERSAIVLDYEVLHRIFEENTLLLVKQNQEPICGGLSMIHNETCTAQQMGVLDGRYDLVKQGSNVALWWFELLWARQHGARRYDIGTSFPVTTDGVFTFKRQWGTNIYHDKESYSRWSFFGKNISSKLLDHLNLQGFIIEADGRHYRVLLLDPHEPFDRANIVEKLDDLAKYGLAGVAVFCGRGERRLIPHGELVKGTAAKNFSNDLQSAAS